MTAGRQPIVLVFDGARTDGEYLVRDSDGTPVARIKRNWSRSAFVVTGGDGSPISSTRRGGILGRRWTTIDPAGRPLVEFKPSGKGGTATFPDGRTAHLKGRWFSSDWALVDGAGTAGVSSRPMKANWIFGARPWAIEITHPAFTIPEVVALVESHRLALDEQSSNAAGSATMLSPGG